MHGIPKDTLMAQVEAFVREQGLEEAEPTFKKGALLAQKPKDFESMIELDEADKEIIRRETTRSSPFLHYLNSHVSCPIDKWRQPKALYLTVVICSLAAAVQCVVF